MASPSNVIFGAETRLQNIQVKVQFKIMGPRSRSRQQKSGSVELKKTTGRKLLWLDRNICYDNA